QLAPSVVGAFRSFENALAARTTRNCPLCSGHSSAPDLRPARAHARQALPRIRRTRFSSASDTYAFPRRWRFRLVVLSNKMCRRPDRLRLILPPPVSLNRLAAERFVFILGIALPFSHVSHVSRFSHSTLIDSRPVGRARRDRF